MGRPRATSLLAGVATLGVSVVLVACSSPGPGGFSWTEVDGPGRLELGDLTASVEDVPIHEAEQQSSNCLVGEDGRVSGEGTWFIDPVGKCMSHYRSRWESAPSVSHSRLTGHRGIGGVNFLSLRAGLKGIRSYSSETDDHRLIHRWLPVRFLAPCLVCRPTSANPALGEMWKRETT